MHTQKTLRLNQEDMKAARDWLKDCAPCWKDFSEEDVDDLTDEEVEAAVELHFEGGLTAFIAA